MIAKTSITSLDIRLSEPPAPPARDQIPFQSFHSRACTNNPENPPKVSVLIPTYNYARHLPEAIESILAQDYRDFELLISDDHSADNSAEIIRRYAARDERIHFSIQTRNLGMVSNWNWCLSEARGTYVKFLFGDDGMASCDALSQLVELLDANPSAVLAASPRYFIDEHSKVTGALNALGRPGLHRGTQVIKHCLVQNGNLIGEPSVVLFRRRDAHRGFNTAYRQLVDMEMWFHLLETGDLAFASEPLSCFRQHSQQQTELNRGRQLGVSESIQLIKEYRCRSYLGKWVVRIILGSSLYDLRKNYRKHPVGPSDDMLRIDQYLSASLGIRWFRMYVIRRRICRPFENLLRWFRNFRYAKHHDCRGIVGPTVTEQMVVRP